MAGPDNAADGGDALLHGGDVKVESSRVRYNPRDVRAYDLVKPHQEMEDGSVKRWLSRLDLWDLSSFRGQTGREKAWNVATRILPCLTWLARYQPKQLPSDIAAGVAVAFLIIPQGLSYASIAGLPAIYGLYTDFVPLFFYFLYGTSMHLQVGAVAIVSLLTANTISELVRSDVDAVAALKSASADDKLLTGAYNAASVALIERQIKTASLLAFLVGVFSFVIGILKLGSIMNLMGPAVISGFQTAAAISIALGQFKNVFGYGKDFTTSNKLPDMLRSFVQYSGQLSLTSTWSGWLWIALLLLFKYLGRVQSVRVRGVPVLKLFKVVGPVLVCILAILATKLGELYLSPGCTVYDEHKGVANVHISSAPASAWNISHKQVSSTDVQGHLVTYTPQVDNPGCVPMPKSSKTPSAVPYPWPKWRGLSITGPFGSPPTFHALDFSLASGPLFTGAIVVTLVASLESIAIARALASKHRQLDLSANAEFVALGMSNMFGSLTRAYPVSGSFSRSALNDEVGATSPVAVLVVAVLVGVILQLASSVPLLYYLPSNALSAVVIVALTNLLDFEHLLWLVVYDRKDALIWVTSFVAVLFLGVEIGILVAVLVSLALVTIETLVAPTPELGMVAGNAGRRAFRSLRQYPDAAKVPGVVVLRIESPILFASAPRILSRIRSLVLGSDAESAEANAARVGTRAVVLDLSNVSYVDSAFLCGFAQIMEDYKREEVLLALANPNSALLHKLTITPLLQSLRNQTGEEHEWVFLTVSDAVEAVKVYERPCKALKEDAPLFETEM